MDKLVGAFSKYCEYQSTLMSKLKNFRRADGVMLLYDVTSERSFTSVRHWVQCIDVSSAAHCFR